jgi:hypothetical protein
MGCDAEDIIELLATEPARHEDATSAIANDTTTENETLTTQLLLFTDGPVLVMHDFRHHGDTFETVQRGLALESMYHINENFWMLEVLAKVLMQLTF